LTILRKGNGRKKGSEGLASVSVFNNGQADNTPGLDTFGPAPNDRRSPVWRSMTIGFPGQPPGIKPFKYRSDTLYWSWLASPVGWLPAVIVKPMITVPIT
jgi:hypothetical protein